MSKKLLGIDLGGTTVKFGILTSEGEVQEKWAIETNTLENGRHIVPNIVESLKHRLEMYGLTAEDFIGIGMGSPGAVNRENKTVTGAFNLNWAETQEVGSVIEKELGIPFAIDNDAVFVIRIIFNGSSVDFYFIFSNFNSCGVIIIIIIIINAVSISITF